MRSSEKKPYLQKFYQTKMKENTNNNLSTGKREIVAWY